MTGSLRVPAAALAHDLRTPVNALQSWSTLLLAGGHGRLDSAALAAVRDMNDAARRLAAIAALLEEPLDDVGPTSRGTCDVDLMALFDVAATAEGWRNHHTDGRLVAVRWEGWMGLVRGSIAALGGADAAHLRLTATTDGTVAIAAEPVSAGTGDGELGRWVLRQRAARAGFPLEEPRAGNVVLRLGDKAAGAASMSWQR